MHFCFDNLLILLLHLTTRAFVTVSVALASDDNLIKDSASLLHLNRKSLSFVSSSRGRKQNNGRCCWHPLTPPNNVTQFDWFDSVTDAPADSIRTRAVSNVLPRTLLYSTAAARRCWFKNNRYKLTPWPLNLIILRKDFTIIHSQKDTFNVLSSRTTQQISVVAFCLCCFLVVRFSTRQEKQCQMLATDRTTNRFRRNDRWNLILSS